MPRSEAARRRGAWALAAGALALCLSLGAAPARASGVPKIFPDPDDGQIVSVWLGCNAAVFGLLDLGYLVAWRPAPPGVSLLQIVIGGAAAPAYALSIERSAALDAAALASIAGHVGIGLANLIAYAAYPKQRQRERKGVDPEMDEDPAYRSEMLRPSERQRTRYRVMFEPRAQGGMVRFYAAL